MTARKKKEAEDAERAAAKTRKTEDAERMAARTKKTEDTGRTAAGAKKAEGAERAAARTKKTEDAERDLTRDDIIRRYLDIYRQCMTEDPKSFDARGAAHALEQISKLLGLTVSAKDTDGNEIVLTLSEEANALGQ